MVKNGGTVGISSLIFDRPNADGLHIKDSAGTALQVDGVEFRNGPGSGVYLRVLHQQSGEMDGGTYSFSGNSFDGSGDNNVEVANDADVKDSAITMAGAGGAGAGDENDIDPNDSDSSSSDSQGAVVWPVITWTDGDPNNSLWSSADNWDSDGDGDGTNDSDDVPGSNSRVVIPTSPAQANADGDGQDYPIYDLSSSTINSLTIEDGASITGDGNDRSLTVSSSTLLKAASGAGGSSIDFQSSGSLTFNGSTTVKSGSEIKNTNSGVSPSLTLSTMDNSGTIDLTNFGSPVRVKEDFLNSGSVTDPRTTEIVLGDTSGSGTFDLTTGGHTFSNLTVEGGFTYRASDNVNVGDGSDDGSAGSNDDGTLDVDGTLVLEQDLSFGADTDTDGSAGTIRLDGTTTQTMTSEEDANHTFNKIRVTNNSADVTFQNEFTTTDLVCQKGDASLIFEHGEVYTITGSLTLNGQGAGTRIVLNSIDGSTRFTFDVTGGEQTVQYVDVSNSEASSNDIVAQKSVDNTNTDSSEASPHWVFGTTWTGNAGTSDWDTSGNWTNGIPDSTTKTFIADPGSDPDPVMNVNGDTETLVVEASGNLDLNGKTLTVHANVKINDTTALLDMSTDGSDLKVKGDWINNGDATAFNQGTQAVTFDAAAGNVQEVKTAETFTYVDVPEADLHITGAMVKINNRLRMGDGDGTQETKTLDVKGSGVLDLNGTVDRTVYLTSRESSTLSNTDRVAFLVRGILEVTHSNVRWLSASGIQFRDDSEIQALNNTTFDYGAGSGVYLNFDADNDQGDGDSIYDVKTPRTVDAGPAVFPGLEFKNTINVSSLKNVDANDDKSTNPVKFQWWNGSSWDTLTTNAVEFSPSYGNLAGASYEEDDGAADTGKVRWGGGSAVLEDASGNINGAFSTLSQAITSADDGDSDLEDNVVTQSGNVLFEPSSDIDISTVDNVKISGIFLNAGITGAGSGSGNRLVNVVVKQDTSDGDTESIGQGTDVNEAFHCMVVDGDINADVAKNCVTVSTGNVTATTTGAANKSGVATSNFVDISNDDFHLKPSASTLIDQGVDISGTLNEDVDFDGNRRPIDDPDTSDNTSTWDIGPDEYGPYAKPETSLMIPSSGTSWSEIGPIEKNARGAAQCIYVPYVSGGTGFVKAYSVDIDGGNLGGNIGTQDGSSHVSGDTVERFVRLYVSRFWHNEWSNPGYRIYAIVDSADDGNTKGGKLYAMRHVDTTADGTKNVDTIVEDSNWGGTVSFSNASLANVDARMLSVTTNDQYIYVTDGYDGTVYRRNVSDGSAAGNDGSHTYDDEFYQLPQTWDDILLAGVEGEKAEVAQLAADLSSVNSTKDLGDGSHLNERLNFDKLSSGRSVYAAPDNPHIWRFASDTLNNEWTDGKSFDIGAPPRSYPGVFPGLEFVWGVARDRIYKVKKSDGSKPNDWGSGSSDWPLTFPNEVLNSSFSYWPFENLMFVSSRSGKAYYVNALLDDDGSGGTVTATGGADGSIVDGWPYIMPNKEITTSKMVWDGSWNFHVLYVYKDKKTGDFRLLGFPFP